MSAALARKTSPAALLCGLWLAALGVAVSLPTTLDGHGVAAWMLLWRLTAAPEDDAGSTRRRVIYTVGERERRADLYMPDVSAGRMPAMVLVPGAVRRGNRDPRFVAFARLLARARFVVLAPDMPLEVNFGLTLCTSGVPDCFADFQGSQYAAAQIFLDGELVRISNVSRAFVALADIPQHLWAEASVYPAGGEFVLSKVTSNTCGT